MDRRAFSAALALLPLCQTGCSSARLNAQESDVLAAWMRLAAATDERLVVWWMSGARYGVVEARSTLLYGMQVGIFQRFFPQADGSWKIAMFELTYYTDLTTGELLEEWDNPYTGETNRVKHVRLGPEIRLQTRTGQYADPDNAFVQKLLQHYSATLGPMRIDGDTLSLPTSVEAVIRFPTPAVPDITLNHYTTVSGSARAALDPGTVSAPAALNFQNIIRWEPWMEMGDHRGHLMSRAQGRKLETVDEMPEDYLSLARTVHPKLIADPLQTLAKTVARIKGTET
ncbi:MAG: DUF1838 family protein [Gammaproteobacteria bacterium]|nr:DUF1838 family protein [Gammaproteobacteria bacterium]